MFWDVPLLAFILAAGFYLIYRQRKVFSQNIQNDNSLVFLFRRCSASDRQEVLRSLLSNQLLFFSLPLVFAVRWALETGGAGALAWFLFFSFCEKGAEAVLALAADFDWPAVLPADWFLRLPEMPSRRKGGQKKTFRCALLLIFWLGFILLNSHPRLLQRAFALAALPLPLLWLLLGVGLGFLYLKERFPFLALLLPLGFFIATLCMFLVNAGNLTLVLRLVLRDALQAKVFVFPYEGRGFLPMLKAAAVLSGLRFLLQLLSRRKEEPSFPHPVFYSAASILQTSLASAVIFVLGIAELLAAADPLSMRPARVLFLLLAAMASAQLLFSAAGMLRAVYRRLGGKRKFFLSAALVLGSCFLLLAGRHFEFFFSNWLCPGFFYYLLAAIRDSSLYFILLEDYRDRYVWHSEAHPRLALHFEREEAAKTEGEEGKVQD